MKITWLRVAGAFLVTAMLIVGGVFGYRSFGGRNARFSIYRVQNRAIERWQAGDYQGYVDVLDEVPDDHPEKARALMQQGRAYWEMRRGRDLERVLARCLEFETDPENPSEATFGAWGLLGDHYLGQERFDEGREVIWRAFEARRRFGRPDPFYLFLLLRMRFESSEPAVALDELERFLASDPDDAQSHRAMGVYLTRLGRLDEARSHFEAAFSAAPTPLLHSNWVWHLLETGDFDAAEKALANLPPACDHRPEIWVYRGKVAERRRDLEGAVKAYAKALEIEPKRLDALASMARINKQRGRSADSSAMIELQKELTQALRELFTLFALHRDATRKTPTCDECLRISELTKTLGWERDSDAWKRVAESMPAK